jgi:thiol-disulfide isomerase/thioredoxin
MNFAFFAAAVMALAAPGDSPRLGTSAHAEDNVLLDFRADWCGPCRQMDSTVEALIAAGYPVRRVNVDQDRALATRYGVQGIPCFVMVVNGREVDRAVGVTEQSRLEAMFSRNGVGKSGSIVRGQSPGTNVLASSGPIPFPATDHSGSIRGALPHPSRVQTDDIPTTDVAAKENTAAEPPVENSRYDKLLRASVRLRIEDENGFSRGSGTIIDSRNGEALIITCGHMFRDAAKNGHIWVDLFGQGAPQGVPGHLIDYDMKSEVGLIRIATTFPVQAACLAPPDYRVHSGEQVVSMGCDGGADATARETHITSIDRYVGAPNLQVAFQPVQGRSGGGLFTPDGQVVGVCYAADPEANEGLFASLPALREELDHMGLSFVYRSPHNQSMDKRAEQALADNRPARENRWPNFDEISRANSDGSEDRRLITRTKDSIVDRQVQPASTKTALDDSKPQQLSPDEAATLQALREEGRGGQVICIVRPQGAKEGENQIIVLDHASPGLLQQLGAPDEQIAVRQPAAPIMSR